MFLSLCVQMDDLLTIPTQESTAVLMDRVQVEDGGGSAQETPRTGRDINEPGTRTESPQLLPSSGNSGIDYSEDGGRISLFRVERRHISGELDFGAFFGGTEIQKSNGSESQRIGRRRLKGKKKRQRNR